MLLAVIIEIKASFSWIVKSKANVINNVSYQENTKAWLI